MLDRLTRSYSGVPVVQDVSVTVPRGALLALLGPSGCGKTTTLRMVAGLDQPDRGRVLVDGRDVTGLPPHRRRMGVVFQSYALFPHLGVLSNVAFGLRMHGVPRRERARRAAAALELVGLAEHASKRPRQLSGGQQQRVALARALAIEPDVLLLDEPLSALDAKLREELRVEMRVLQRRLGATAVFVTHDQAEALAMADLVAVMEAGRIAQLGTPEEVFERPATPFVASFVGRSARLLGAVEDTDGVLARATDGVRGRVTGGVGARIAQETRAVRAGPALLRFAAPVSPDRPPLPPLPAGAAVQVFVRPHRVHIVDPGDPDPPDNALDGTVAAIDYTGESVQVVVDTPAGRVPVDLPTTSGAWRALQPGQPVRVGWRAEDTLCFPA